VYNKHLLDLEGQEVLHVKSVNLSLIIFNTPPQVYNYMLSNICTNIIIIGTACKNRACSRKEHALDPLNGSDYTNLTTLHTINKQDLVNVRYIPQSTIDI